LPGEHRKIFVIQKALATLVDYRGKNTTVLVWLIQKFLKIEKQ